MSHQIHPYHKDFAYVTHKASKYDGEIVRGKEVRAMAVPAEVSRSTNYLPNCE